MLEFETLKQAFSERTFFKNKSWQLSPTPLELPSEIVNELNPIGEACFEFLSGINKLYQASKANKSILRNKHFTVPWVADYFDKGKTKKILEHANLELLKSTIPKVIRLDLLLIEGGVALTEIEVIPGGIGFTSFLHQLYQNKNNELIGSSQAMLNGFYESMANLMPYNQNPIIVLAVSNESETYRPEFQWLAEELQKSGKQVYCIDPETIYYEDSKLKFVNNEKIIEINVIYRFFELFDLKNISTSSIIMQAIENQEVIVSPPFKPIFEEKLCLALFHHYQLQDYWKETLTKTSLQLLKKIIPSTWIVDSTPFGPNAMLNGPIINKKNLASWDELGNATQKHRNYILKVSGFHEKAWGARSVTLGSDCSQKDWSKKIKEATESFKENPFIIQEFKKPKRIMHPIYNEKGIIEMKPGRARLCPYYMKNDAKITVKGILATICPADKKIIHGMSVATFVPCKSTNE